MAYILEFDIFQRLHRPWQHFLASEWSPSFQIMPLNHPGVLRFPVPFSVCPLSLGQSLPYSLKLKALCVFWHWQPPFWGFRNTSSLPYNPNPSQSGLEPGISPLTFRRRGKYKVRKPKKIQGNSVVEVWKSFSNRKLN